MTDVVLLLEDEKDLAALVTEILTDEGYRVIHVTEVEELLQAARQSSPCVALLDGKSPTRFDLWHLGPQLRALGVPPVAFTAHSSAVQEFQQDPRGFVGVVSKPFDADQFVATVNSICWDDYHAAAS